MGVAAFLCRMSAECLCLPNQNEFCSQIQNTRLSVEEKSMSRGVRHDASGRFYSELPKEDDDPFKNISTEELRRRAIDEEAVKESERAL
jgi:hypothetical protein